MKGGVGKSTLTVNLAWHYAGLLKWSKRVLVVDLDPQFNSSQYLLGAQGYQEKVIDAERPTVWDIFEQNTKIPGDSKTPRDLSKAVINVVSFHGGSKIDLIPSQLELSYTLKNAAQKEALLRDYIAEIEDNYDVILIDCAPTDSILTDAAYLTSDYILTPVRPEFLSAIGLPLLQESINRFKKQYKKKIELAGIVFNHGSNYAPEETTTKEEVKEVATKFNWHIFSQEIPYSRSFPKGAREGQPIFRTSYSRSDVCTRVRSFMDAFAKRVGI